MPKPLNILLRVGLLLAVLVAIALFLLLVALPSSERWAWSQTLSTALSNASSVTFVEFTTYRGSDTSETPPREVVLQRIAATPEQIKGLRSATSRFFVFSYYTVIPGCFHPHHRVEVIRRDGSRFQMELSFDCWDFRFDQKHEEAIPLSWLPLLRQFFSDLGMPPHTEAIYEQLAEQKAKFSPLPTPN